MAKLKNIFTPLAIIDKKVVFLLLFIEIIIGVVIWSFSPNVLIPSPAIVGKAIIGILSSANFYDNFFNSLSLTVQGMSYSIVISLIISYMSLVPVLSPIALFVMKCRYLTLTGLIFLFTLLTDNGHQLKMNLLIFGIVPFFVTSFLSTINDINVQEFDLCKTLKMSNWKTLWEVVIIGRLDQVLEVMRQNFAIAWMMITMVEGLSMSEGGLGTMLIKANKYIDLSTVFSILIIIFTVGLLIDYLLRIIRHWLFPYTRLHLRK